MELGMYVAVSDLAASKSFYSELFGVDPYVENENFVGFEAAGGRFGIIREDRYAHELIRGNSAVPNIKVENIEAEYQRVKGLNPSLIQDQIQQAGPMRLFMFKDPDGNVIEFYAVD